MIKKVISIFLLFVSSLFADMKNENITPEIADSNITIIDIRTEPEWRQTGIIKNSIPITFFTVTGNYDAQGFIKELDKYVTKDKAFAIVCRTGSRTSVVAKFLSDEGYNVINLKGGVNSLMAQGYKLSPYEQ